MGASQSPENAPRKGSPTGANAAIALLSTAIGSVGLRWGLTAVGGISAPADWRGHLAFGGVVALVSGVSALVARLGMHRGVAIGISLVGAISAVMLRNNIPIAAFGLMAVTFVALFYATRVMRWLMNYLFATVYGAGMGGAIYYLVTYHEGWVRYLEATGVGVVGIALASYVVSWLRRPHPDEQFVRAKNVWRFANQSLLLLAVVAASAGTVGLAAGVDWQDLVKRYRKPMEQKLEQVENAVDKLDQARALEQRLKKMIGSLDENE